MPKTGVPKICCIFYLHKVQTCQSAEELESVLKLQDHMSARWALKSKSKIHSCINEQSVITHPYQPVTLHSSFIRSGWIAGWSEFWPFRTDTYQPTAIRTWAKSLLIVNDQSQQLCDKITNWCSRIATSSSTQALRTNASATVQGVGISSVFAWKWTSRASVYTSYKYHSDKQIDCSNPSSITITIGLVDDFHVVKCGLIPLTNDTLITRHEGFNWVFRPVINKSLK